MVAAASLRSFGYLLVLNGVKQLDIDKSEKMLYNNWCNKKSLEFSFVGRLSCCVMRSGVLTEFSE